MLSILIISSLTAIMVAALSISPHRDQSKEMTDKLISFLRFEKAEASNQGFEIRISFVSSNSLIVEIKEDINKEDEGAPDWVAKNTLTLKDFGSPPEMADVIIEEFEPIYIYPDGSTSGGSISLVIENNAKTISITQFGDIKILID